LQRIEDIAKILAPKRNIKKQGADREANERSP
jgi:hypothetical protein